MKLCLEDPPPTLPNPKSNVLAEIDDSRLPDSLERLAYTQKRSGPTRRLLLSLHHLLLPTAIAD